MGIAEQIEAEPVFQSAHGALMFAMNFSHGSLKKSFLAMATGTARPGRGLAGLDGAAQAGMILAELLPLSEVFRTMLIARFAPRRSECACRSTCCSGYRENQDWSEAVAYLAQYALTQGLTGTISHLRLRQTLVRRFFGVKEGSLIAVAQACGIHRNTAGEYNKAVFEHFRTKEALAMESIDDRLKAAGIVG